jgi:hypothetical protein
MTREEAIKMYDTGWWQHATDQEIVAFQLFEEKLCMPFGRFHEAVEKCLERPVFTHEFGLAHEQLKAEFLKQRPKSTFAEIMALIPKEKQIIIAVK